MRSSIGIKLLPVSLIMLILVSCLPAETKSIATSSTNPPPQLIATATIRETLAATATVLQPTPTMQFQLCSPLQGIALAELPKIITNPFQLPPISLDDGHHGVDFAFYQFKQFKTMEGLPISAVLAGTVAAVDINRPPYGNMIIIETPLDQIPGDLQTKSQFPTPAPTAVNDGRLSCPSSGPSPVFHGEGRSLYILYAHMKDAPLFQVGQKVERCQQIGEVGSTGESSQFHLHLETRIGPAGAQFTSIAHRSTSASPEEMYNYCVWRISNIFEKFDPMLFLSVQP